MLFDKSHSVFSNKDPAHWPTNPQSAFYHAKNLYEVTRAYMENTFPDYCHRRSMRAFDCGGSALPEAMRLDLFQDLAAKENCDKHEVRLQMGSILPMTKAIYADEGCNERTWCQVVDACRTQQDRSLFRSSRRCVVRFGLTYLGVCDTTTDVERNLRAVSAFQEGSKYNHYRIEILNAAMQVWMEAPRALNKLVETVEVGDKNAVVEIWRPKQFIQDAMDWYARFYGTRSLKCRETIAPHADEVAVSHCPRRRLPGLNERKQKLVSKKGKITRTGVDHDWNKAVTQACRNSSDGTLLSPRLPCGTQRPPLDKRKTPTWTKNIITKLHGLVISNRAEFKKGEADNNLGRPPRPLHPGHRHLNSAKSKELEREKFEKAKKMLAASTPTVIAPVPVQAVRDAVQIREKPNGKISVWVPNGMAPDTDTTIEAPCKHVGGFCPPAKPWVKVEAMVNADMILCNDLKTANLQTKLCAKLFRLPMVDLEYMNSSGQRGKVLDNPPLGKNARTTMVDIYVTPCAKQKHHCAISLLESFIDHAALVQAQGNYWSRNLKTKGRKYVYKLKVHYDLDAFFGNVKKSRLDFTFIICTGENTHELRELASFKFGHRKDSSVIERSVTSFHAFVACL